MTNKPMTKKQWLILIVVFSIVATGFNIYAYGWKETFALSKGVNLDEYHAFDSAQRNVKQQLKAPSTAKFASKSEVGSTIGDTKINGDDVLVVKSYVDAQNEYGAQVRSYYTAYMMKSGDDWVLEQPIFFK